MQRRNKVVITAFFISLLLLVGGVFYWRSQKDVRELNKNLPKKIKVVKTLSEKYKIVNKIDGYEFKIPNEWKGIKEIKYMPEDTEKGYTSSSIGLEGKKGESRIIAIDIFKVTDPKNINLELWVRDNFETFGLVGDFKKDKVGNFEIIKTKEDTHLLGMCIYFFKKEPFIYAIAGGSEEFIQDIIINGKW